MFSAAQTENFSNEPGPDFCSSPAMDTTQDDGLPYPPSLDYSDTSSEGSVDESIASVEVDENDESFVLLEDDSYV